MSDALLRSALVGIAREAGRAPADGRLDALLPRRPLTEERRLLLLAGIDAVRRRAGYQPPRQDAPPSRVPDETKPVCSKKVADVLSDLGLSNDALLLEAAHLLARAGQRLPPELLVLFLSNILEEELRNAFLPILGERGAWLAQFRSDWSWAAQPATSLDAKEIWAEGVFEKRLRLIRGLRAGNPALARSLLESSWKEEKAEHRAQLIEQMEAGLSAADEAFLESALDDRSAQVRSAAASLLARIDGSAFAARMARRADAMLGSYLPFQVSLPGELDAAAQHDGIPRNPPRGTGAKAFWLARTIALVRPRHWELRFAAAPARIVAAALRSDESAALLQGFTEATMLFEERAWAAPLFDAWIERIPLAEALSLLPASWTADFSLRVVEAVRRTSADPDVQAWAVAAEAVAPEVMPQLAVALERANGEPLSPYEEQKLDEAREMLRVRRILHEELPAPGRSTA
jgi:Family of unknown function (DUF5691)